MRLVMSVAEVPLVWVKVPLAAAEKSPPTFQLSGMNEYGAALNPTFTLLVLSTLVCHCTPISEASRTKAWLSLCWMSLISSVWLAWV